MFWRARAPTYFQFRDAGLRLLGAGQIPDVLAMFLREFRFELADAIVQLDEMMGTLRRTTWTTMYLVQGVTFLLRS